MEVEVGAEDVVCRVAGGVGFAGARFGEEEGVRDFFERLGAGEVEFMSAQLFAFRGDDCAAQRARRDVADGAQARSSSPSAAITVPRSARAVT